jgi:hypothetical protein
MLPLLMASTHALALFAFPPGTDDPFSGVMTIFLDEEFPSLDADVTIETDVITDDAIVSFSSEQFGIEQVANLLFACAKSALPIGFE